ncbi:uncharacterized protein LOC144661430 [Oculina patagonica]
MLLAKKMQRNKETITDLAKKTLLPMDDVRMWLEHLDQVHKNRVEGAQRAAAKRKSKSGKKAVQADAYCLCGEGEHGLMISCDGENCPIFWFHVNCVGLSEESVPGGSWYCHQCKH